MRRDVAAPRDLPLFEGQAFVGGTPLPLGPERCVPATHWAGSRIRWWPFHSLMQASGILLNFF